MTMAAYTCGPTTIYYDPAQVRISGMTIYPVDQGTVGATVTVIYQRWEAAPETVVEAKARRLAEHRRACQQHFRHDRIPRAVKPVRVNDGGVAAVRRKVCGATGHRRTGVALKKRIALIGTQNG